MANALGEFAPFALYGFINFVGVFFIMFFLTETKGKTEYEIYRDIRGEKESDNAQAKYLQYNGKLQYNDWKKTLRDPTLTLI